MTDQPEADAELERRIQALEDEQAIRTTLQAFAHAMDAGDPEAWLDCFTPEASYDVEVGAQTGGDDRSSRTRGRAELQAFAEARQPTGDARRRHLVAEPTITVAGNEASATSYFVRVEWFAGDPAPRQPFVRSFGRYVDRFVRCDDGRWRIAERVAQVDALTRGEGPPRVSD